MVVVVIIVLLCVVAVVFDVVAYRQNPTRKYLLAWLSSEPGLSACDILYRTRGVPHSRSMRERTNKKREIVFFFLLRLKRTRMKDRDCGSQWQEGW